MQLRVVLFVTFGPALTSCSLAAATAESNGASVMEVMSRKLADSKPECAHVPLMPQTFFAKRRWGTFLNTIDFSDQFGREFGYVQSNFVDTKNLLGYPGASFYLKASAKKASRAGTWNLDPSKAESVPNPSVIGVPTLTPVEKAAVVVPAVGDKENELYATMKALHPVAYEVSVKDCDGVQKFEADKKTLHVQKAGSDAQFYTKEDSTENSFIVTDLSTPAIELVRVFMASPCTPFPPFCSQMGRHSWFTIGTAWEGQIVQPGYNSSVAGGSIGLQMTDGASTDMRFLALYTSYQFSNTRWGPLVLLFLNFTLLLCCVCCLHCCFCVYRHRSKKEVHSYKEEHQKLMGAVEHGHEDNGQAVKEKPDSLFNCCSRKGRTVHAAPSHH